MEQRKQWKQQQKSDLNKDQIRTKIRTDRWWVTSSCEKNCSSSWKRDYLFNHLPCVCAGGWGLMADLFFLCFSWWSGWMTPCWTSPATAPGTPLKPEPPRLLYPQVIGSSRHILGTRPTSPEARGSLWEQSKQTFRKKNADRTSEFSLAK